MRTSSYANDELRKVKKQEDYKSIFATTFRYLWPDELIFRIRVIASLFCLVLAKVFTVLTPLLLLLFGITALTKEAYFIFANILPQNNILNSGFLEKLNNHIIYSLILSFLIVFLTVYLLPKTLGRKLLIFPIFFLASE